RNSVAILAQQPLIDLKLLFPPSFYSLIGNHDYLWKTDPQIKASAQNVAEKMGLSLTSVINRYLKHFITTETITFSTRDEQPSEYLLESLRKSDEDIKKGRVSPDFKNARYVELDENKEVSQSPAKAPYPLTPRKFSRGRCF
ncbi:MAG: type II toxin-antitoxin system RelB/DinJ family antitoxin, partial [Candidatus Sungbacteria bacterium]|nr:type II toxin-antitoxin system RelB/DinJ family antitoxin [Candidatus Sungbacteria bacterium]